MPLAHGGSGVSTEHRPWFWPGVALYAAVVGSALYALAYPPASFAPLAWVAYSLPLAALCRVRTPSEARLLGLVFGTLSHALVLRWLVAIFGSASIALLLIFGLLHALAFSVLFHLRERLGNGRMLLLSPVLLVGIECFRSEWWYLRFPWASTGYAQIADARVGQAVDVVGVYGLSFACLSASALLAGAVVARSFERRVLAASLAFALYTALALLGALRERAVRTDLALEDEAVPEGLRVAVVQYETNRVEDALALASEIPEDVDLAVFPELGAALLGGRAAHADDPGMALALQTLAARARAVVVIGATEAAPDAPDAFYNTMLVLDEDGGRMASYHKAEPVPLFADGVRSGPSGPRDTRIGRLGLAICYDFTHSHVTAVSLAGAELAVVVSGDLASWTALQHDQHRAIARLRAIEHRLYVVRATSSGVSHVIDPLGHELAAIGFEDRGVAVATVYLRHGRTIASHLGMTLPYVCLLAAVGMTVWVLVSTWRWPTRKSAAKTAYTAAQLC